MYINVCTIRLQLIQTFKSLIRALIETLEVNLNTLRSEPSSLEVNLKTLKSEVASHMSVFNIKKK